MTKPSIPHRNSIAEFFNVFDTRPRDIVYVQPYGYRTARWTYGRFAETAAQFARELDSRGVAAGDRVVIWGPNSAEWAAAFWGCILHGAVVVPMDWIATDDFARRVVDQVQAKLLVVAKEKSAALENTPAISLEDLPQTVSRQSTGKPGARYDSPKLDHNSLAEIVFTSGTTAEPKGVMITHGNILANLEPVEEEIRKYVKFEWPFHPIRFLNLLPLSHVFGQFLGLFFPAVLSGSVFFEDSFNPADMIRTIHDERISVLVAVPRVLDSLKHKLERDIEDAGRSAKFAAEFDAAKGERFYRHWLRFWSIHREFGLKFWAMICGGASLSRDTEEFWDRLGIAVVQGYGLTETTSLISLNHPFQLGRGSIGKILPGREVKLGLGGEILVRGDSVATGYWRGANPAETSAEPASTEDQGWLHTGDIGELDAEGNLYFKGRQKNVIVTSAGMNVYPADIESALHRQPEIRDCIVLAVPQSSDTEAVAVLLLRDPNSDAKAAVERANSELAEYQRIRRWFVWPEPDFPRTSTGKPRTNLISARVAAPESRAPEQTPRAAQQGTLEDLIAQITHRNVASLQPSAKLEADLGLSSLDRVELLSALEDRYLVSFNEADVSGETTIADLRRLLDQPIPVPASPQPFAAAQCTRKNSIWNSHDIRDRRCANCRLPCTGARHAVRSAPIAFNRHLPPLGAKLARRLDAQLHLHNSQLASHTHPRAPACSRPRKTRKRPRPAPHRLQSHFGSRHRLHRRRASRALPLPPRNRHGWRTPARHASPLSNSRILGQPARPHELFSCHAALQRVPASQKKRLSPGIPLRGRIRGSRLQPHRVSRRRSHSRWLH